MQTPNRIARLLPNTNGADLTIVKVAFTAEQAATVRHSLRTLIEATRRVMNEGPLPAPVRMARAREIEAMESALTTMVEQGKLAGD